MRSTASIPFYLCLACLLAMLCSCGFVHKVFNKQKVSTDSVATHYVDTASGHRFDSASAHQLDSVKTKKETASYDSGVEILFNDSTSSRVTISTDSTGVKHIQAEGKIKSVLTKDKRHKASSDSSALAMSGHTSVSSKDTTHGASGSLVALEKKDKTLEQEKKAWQVPWYGYVVICLFVIILIVGYLAYRQYLKPLLPPPPSPRK